MRALQLLVGTSALALAGLAAQASEFTPLLRVTQATWPGKNHLGVVCNYAESRDQIQALREAAGPEATITVVDARGEQHLASARVILLDRHADFLVLLPRGGAFREGTIGSTRLVRALASNGLPSIGTTPAAIQQGAVFAVGERTGWNLLVSNHLVGTITVVLPQKGQAFRGGVGMATLDLVGMGD